jgi:ERCC4-type nuclease
MRVIIDERERDLYERCSGILSGNTLAIQLEREVLPIGDICIKTDDGKDVLLVERKSLQDLLASIKDGRYEEQSYRLIHSSGYPVHSVIYVIEGMLSTLRTPMERRIVYSAITTLNYFKGFSVMRTSSVGETADLLIWMAEKIERNFAKAMIPYYLQPYYQGSPKNEQASNTNENTLTETGIPMVQPPNYCTVVKKVKKDNITPNNIGEIVLCQIPGISSVTAIAIMQKFSTFPKLLKQLETDPNCMNDITITANGKTRKISKACIESIKHFFIDNRGLDHAIPDPPH